MTKKESVGRRTQRVPRLPHLGALSLACLVGQALSPAESERPPC
jgi:hypothetical protein